ncbi:hypothetical protein RFI_18602 [Reticulomyxa filosa]|uniref:SAM domain-containing protein n=1 Tax=Reticulomyxa filosa TaxID=46433 RepID=X6MYE9_RETFI|nr:hypothetical protein RFI_18602 [Reticulomyxa filosa]|eukprot:ETO18658.1 hypothetical protein RFI_18602 [Reticulomyxa filosa]
MCVAIDLHLKSTSLYLLLKKKKKKFEAWLRETVKLSQYLSQFQSYGYNDIRMVMYIDEQVLIEDIQMDKKPHRLIFLKKAGDLRRQLTEVNLSFALFYVNSLIIKVDDNAVLYKVRRLAKKNSLSTIFIQI